MYITARHYPVIIDAPSIEVAAEGICKNAEQVFPKDRGWQIRNATIRAVPPETAARLLPIVEGVARGTDPVEEAKIVMCDSYAPKPEDAIIWEFGKPAA